MLRMIPSMLVVLLCFPGEANAQRQSARHEMGFNVVGFSFVAIQVENVAEAAEWYSATLGLAEVKQLEAEDGRYSIRLLSGSGLSVELIRSRGATQRTHEPHLGLFKLGFYVDQIDGALAWLRGRGVDTDQSIFVDEALNVRTFVFRDPYGNRLQVLQRCEDECNR